MLMPVSTQRTEEDRKMIKQLLKTLAVMTVLLSLAAVPALAATKNGPIVATLHNTGQIELIDPTTGERSAVFGAVADTSTNASPSVTPDGKTVVYVGPREPREEDPSNGNLELFSIPIDGSVAPTQITPSTSEPNSWKRDPVVSPDGQTVYFNWDRFGSDENFHHDLYSVPIGGGEPTRIVEDTSTTSGMKITPDGRYLVYPTADATTGEITRVEAMSVNGGPTHTVVDNTRSFGLTNGTFAGQLTISPDGKTVVMIGVDRSSNSTSLYTAPLNLPTSRTSKATKILGTTLTPWQDSDTGENNSYVSAAFSPDGKSIAYNLWTTQPEIGGFLIEEIRSVPATGGTPTVIVPMGNGESGSILHLNLIWAPQVVPSVVPEVVDTEPDNGATGVAKTIKPKATFNTELDASTVNAQNVRLEIYNSTKNKWVPVDSTPSYDRDTKTVTVTPAKSLGSQKEYRVTLSTSIKSSTDEALASLYSWSFTAAT
jgi:Tol biopolymer transport system component